MSDSPKKKGPPKPSVLIVAVTAAVLIGIVVIAAKSYGKEDGSDKARSTSRVVSASAAVQTQQPAGTTCPQFSVGGATCEISTEGSAWIRPDSSSSTITGAKYCWDNKPDEFEKIEYLIGGRTHTFDPAGPEPQGAAAYRFFPKEPTTLIYNLAEQCRS